MKPPGGKFIHLAFRVFLTMIDSLYIAVDLGAGSGRVFLGGLREGEFLLEEAHRFHYPPVDEAGHLRWDLAKIFAEIKAGLRCAGERASELGCRVHSLGVDSWAVDYGLLDAGGKLIENPVCYRDERTQGMMEKVFARLSRQEIFARTGIQFLAFNTLYQLYAQKQEGLPETASQLLLIPDLINFFLTGRAAGEYTNATTTQMMNAGSQSWDREILEPLELPAHLLPEIVPAGTELGELKPLLAEELHLEAIKVIATATHDTASAVAGAPLEEGRAYISSGTWSLVGVERRAALINAEVARHNFTNEGGAFGTIRFLKNVCGLWILESCRRQWQERGLEVDYDTLLREVEAIDEYPALIFPDDARFFNPPSMLDAIAEHLAEVGQHGLTDAASRSPIASSGFMDHPPVVAKVILDSLAFRYASVLRVIESLTGGRIDGVQIVGGGSLNDYLNQATANASGKMVLAGPVEATVTGNILVQAIAAGRFASLREARQYVARNLQPKKFMPRLSPQLEDAARRYATIEARYAGQVDL
jgi:rhamnulokinase